jgi:Restriction endonuclease
MLKIFTDLYIKVNKLDAPPPQKSNENDLSQKQARSPKVFMRREPGATQMYVEAKRINKTLTPKTRREVLNRDKCCQSVNKDTGEICGETSFVQVDHKTPIWAGGSHEMENLQVLCANHNRRKYRKESQLSWL